MYGEIGSQSPVHGNLRVYLRVLVYLSIWLLSVIKISFRNIYDHCPLLLFVIKRSFWSIYDQCSLLFFVMKISFWSIYDLCSWILLHVIRCLFDIFDYTCEYCERGYGWVLFQIKRGRFLFRKFFEKESSCSLPLVIQLPDEVMEMVVQHLSLRDRIRMINVCKSWRKLLNSLACHPPEVPWLLLLNRKLRETGGKSLRFYSMSDNEFIKLRLPNHITRTWSGWDCLFSSNGWLLIAIEPHSKNHRLLLLDPLSGETLSLPSLSTLPFFDAYVEWLMSRPDWTYPYAYAYAYTVRWMIEEIAVSTSPADWINTNDLLVAATFDVLDDMEEKMAFCKPNEKEWTIFHQDTDIHPPYSGLLFYKGCLYANRYIYRMNLQEGRNNITTECTTSLSADLNLKVMFNDIIVNEHPITARERYFSFFVNSAEGDLLRVVQNKRLYEDNDNEGVTIGKTSSFEVFYYGDNENLMSLGDQVLFLSQNSGPASLSSRTSNCWVPSNSICFQTNWTNKYHELGIFGVEDELIQPFIPDQLQQKTRALWFTPKCRSNRWS